MPSNFPTATTEASSSRDHARSFDVALEKKTLRDEFAMISMAIVMRSAENGSQPNGSLEDFAYQCFVLADAMLAVRARFSSAEQVASDSSRDEPKEGAV